MTHAEKYSLWGKIKVHQRPSMCVADTNRHSKPQAFKLILTWTLKLSLNPEMNGDGQQVYPLRSHLKIHGNSTSFPSDSLQRSFHKYFIQNDFFFTESVGRWKIKRKDRCAHCSNQNVRGTSGLNNNSTLCFGSGRFTVVGFCTSRRWDFAMCQAKWKSINNRLFKSHIYVSVYRN